MASTLPPTGKLSVNHLAHVPRGIDRDALSRRWSEPVHSTADHDAQVCLCNSLVKLLRRETHASRLSGDEKIEQPLKVSGVRFAIERIYFFASVVAHGCNNESAER